MILDISPHFLIIELNSQKGDWMKIIGIYSFDFIFHDIMIIE